ncbi:light-harvesting antenna LH1, alpha subunit [Thiococcus pfennigii]|uniref:light-harvesting antenna LH1, alpha subunit n=1 Tax=Thiococcus pfennigii TaxID=1057 RepID=UPI0019040102|nr:light-harvesting antenna LH1, alpha subunit [Thiococcus pfennigii]MBK1732807.1 light-harvesting protein [Thiococcus pfennigii]
MNTMMTKSGPQAGTWQIWKILDPARTLWALTWFLIVLGLLIHILLLKSDDLNWHTDGRPVPFKDAAAYKRAQAGLPY